MRNVLFIASQDVRNQLRQGSTLVWLFVMPPIFFYFIGTVTGGFSSSISGGEPTPLTVLAQTPGFLQEQIHLRLTDNDFAPEWITSLNPKPDKEMPRTLTFDAGLSDKILAEETSKVSYDTTANALTRQFEAIRIQRGLYTALADIVIADANSTTELTSEALAALNNTPRIWQLEVAPAGERQQVPSGFEQAVPGILVMFTLLVLLTSGASMLVLERKQGLLRRLASAPISKTEVISGKWGGRMVLAALQVAAALIVGTFLFKMNWGPDFGMVIIVLAAWAGFCASAGLWLGSMAKTEAQAGGLGVLAANALAALGGCWWPIEVTPEWMQLVQKFLPTGWTMDALHKLISFQSGAFSAIPNVAILVLATAMLAWLAIRRFQYQ